MVLVAASPCALAISVPLTVVAAIGSASKFGVIIKSGAVFERFGVIRHVAVDKTGTLTRNEPAVTAVLTTDGVDEAQALAWAASLEQGTAPTRWPPRSPPPRPEPRRPGRDRAGRARHRGHPRRGPGHRRRPRWLDAGTLKDQVAGLEEQGMTVVIVHRDGAPVAAIGVRDVARPEVPEVVRTLAAQGVGMTMLTGDNARTARALAAQAGIDDVRAEPRPEDKAAAISELGRHGSVAMIGDGINDAPRPGRRGHRHRDGRDRLRRRDRVRRRRLHRPRPATPPARVRPRPPRQAHHQPEHHPVPADHHRAPPLALFGVLGLAAVVLVHEIAEVIVILNGLRAARTRKTAS